MVKAKLDFEHKAIIAIIFLALFGFFFLVLGITFTGLGYTSTYQMFRWMGPVMAGIALIMIVVVCVLGYKVSVTRTKHTLERQRQMAILQRASTMRLKNPYSEPEVPGHYAFAGGEEGEYIANGMSNPAYQSSQGYLQKPTSVSAYPPGSTSSYQPNQQAQTIPVQQPIAAPSPAGYSPYPQGMVAVPDSLNSSHSSLVGVPAMGYGISPHDMAAPVSSQQIVLTAPTIDTARPRRPAPGRPVSLTGSALPQ